MATINRTVEVELFCESLKLQTYGNYELIIVDQNEGDAVFKIYEKYRQYYSIRYIKSAVKGLSYNRNIGLKQATGDIIAFPDDDCEYQPNTLELAFGAITDKNLDYFIFNSVDKNNLSMPGYSRKIFYMKKSKYFSVGVSYTLFIKKKLINGFKFDLRLGCGADFGSGEETDLILFLIKLKAIGYYNGEYYIFHPYKPLRGDVARAYNYAEGYGALHRKAFSYYKYYDLIFPYIFSILKNIIGVLLTAHKKYHWYVLKGKLIGFIKYKVVNQ
jgi:glycosyltransferase involved in cell wall biosynthesis